MTQRNVTIERAATLGARRQTQYWLVASARDMASLLHGHVSRAVYAQAVQNFHQGIGESSGAYAARRLEQDNEREDVIPCECKTGTVIHGAAASANGADIPSTTSQRPVAVVARLNPVLKTSRNSQRRGNAL